MRIMLQGFRGWAEMRDGRTEPLRVIDTAITVVVTLLVAVTWTVFGRK